MELRVLDALLACRTTKMMWKWSPWSNVAKVGHLFVVGGTTVMESLWRMKVYGMSTELPPVGHVVPVVWRVVSDDDVVGVGSSRREESVRSVVVV
jgi:hypothetical protein